MVHDSDDGRIPSGIGSVEGDPIGAFAPGVFSGQSLAGDDTTFGDFSFIANGRCHADREGAFFGISENHVAVDGFEVTRHFYGAVGSRGLYFVSPLLGKDGIFSFGQPFQINCEGQARGARFGFFNDRFADEAVGKDLAAVFAAVPEVTAVDIAVSEPKSDVVRVVVLLTGDVFLEREPTGEMRSVRTHQGVKAGDGFVGSVFGEEFAVDGDPEVVAIFSCRDPGVEREAAKDEDKGVEEAFCDGIHGFS